MSGPRILIVRLSAFGDCVLTMPLLCALRRQHPDAYIAWLTQKNCASVLAGHLHLDELLTVERGYLKNWQKVRALRSELRRRRFDVAIDPQGLLKSSFAAWLSGAPQRIGFAAPLGREGSSYLNNTRIHPESPHIIERQIELLTPLGAVPEGVEFQVPIDNKAEQMIDDWRAESMVGEYGVFNPGAAWPSKCWPLERYAESARRIKQSTGVTTVITWGGAKEEAWARQLVDLAPQATMMAPPTNLRELASLLRRARYAVASDTGPLHLAEAVGVPCVGVYGPTRAEQSAPYGPQHILLQKRYHEGTSRERRTAGNEAICLISADEVADACVSIVNRRAVAA